MNIAHSLITIPQLFLIPMHLPVFYKNDTKILRSQLEFPFHGPDQYPMIAAILLSHFKTQFQYL